MEGALRNAFEFEVAADGGGSGGDGGRDDAKVLAGLSTVLVATIQEVKDRISHIEFLFCSQLFPRIQSRSRTLQGRLSAAEARGAAGEEWAEKKASFLRQIEELRLGKQRAEEEALRQIEELRLGKKREEEEALRQIEELRLGKQRAEEEARRLAASAEKERAEMASRHEAKKALLLEKLESAERASETTVAELKEQLGTCAGELKQCKGLVEKLLEQNDQKEIELEGEKRKRKQLANACARLEKSYKDLKSQYCFLLRKVGLAPDPTSGMDGEAFSPVSLPNKRKSPQGKTLLPYHIFDMKNRDEGVNAVAARTDELEVEGDARQRVSSSNATSSSDLATVSSKPDLLGGPKLTLPSWVDTRARQEARGRDPHDDFLDTPSDNIRENLRRMQDDSPHGIPDLAANNEDVNDSDEDIKQVNVAPVAQKPQFSVLKPEKRGHKYVEPVRKKVDRENLKGVECKQCKKFYDAVLPDDRGKDPGEFRCEHHEGVSRHRYRYFPPMTPEGFWNIGFDSDI
ncbi:hypothetical protein Taro_022968 [Colocasia esculenta]|uniref:DNA endonuclease activator Ctp1 C-terminal domain-containing protein n=1 Tax=Colocasia esculenta TaxID=4460 RepID=A0A843V558_COLES|nr:hypothetical protein [Colocasia esculenta]